MAHVEIEKSTYSIRAVLFGDDGYVQDIVESADPAVLAEELTERGWRGTGLRIFWKDIALDEGALSLTEELEIVNLS